MYTYFTLKNQQLIMQEQQDESTLWTHIEKPTEQQTHQLAKKYNLPQDYLTSIWDDAENSREEGLQQEHFKKAILLLLQFPHETLSANGFLTYETYPLSLILTPDLKIITVSNQPPLFFSFIKEHLFPENDIRPELNIFLQVLWRLVLSYNHALKKIKLHIEEIEKQIQVSTENKQLYQVLNLQKSLVLFDAATKGNLETLTALAKTQTFQKHHAYKNHLHDILVEVQQAITSVSIQLKFVNQMNETFSAIVSNNLNNVMKILTSLTIVLTIPTIIGGIFGMNVALPFANHESAFLIISLLTLLLCIIAIGYLKKKNLL